MTARSKRWNDIGIVLILLGAAAIAVSWLGFSIASLAILVVGAVAFVAGLILLRPTARTLLWLFVMIGFVTLPVWLMFLVGALSG
ncbi:MAG: hypothetical protein F4088_07005 [Chloroflexi bacterium]|nr:hypothetical protein [Chloroflexota bacterium]MYF09146.1 hypothetical protein [Rhodospirillaceae bacterium]MXY85362.1 hypothetical protein [Chloroflexota bacterium]MYB22694.1 hypothetical protein [Chloroflexota bacterium]MYD74486.1 hypothetical protein [Chloroflexota bacterium]